jgi:hypothetical protein
MGPQVVELSLGKLQLARPWPAAPDGPALGGAPQCALVSSDLARDRRERTPHTLSIEPV